MLRGAISIFGRDLRVLRRSLFSELLAVVASPLTLYLAFGIGLRGYIADVEGVPYPVFIAPGLISMTAVTAAFDESAWSMWFHRRVQKTIEEYRTTPITVYDIVIGKIFSGFAQGAIKGLAVAVVIFLLTPFRFTAVNLLAYLWLPGDMTALAEKALRKDPAWTAPLLWRSEFRNILIGYLRRNRLTLEAVMRPVTRMTDAELPWT